MREVILIDDDELIHELWKMAAKDADVSLACFKTVDAFLENAKNFSIETNVYIDSNLENSRGEVEACRVKEAGFDNIYIATGYNKEDVNAPDFVLDVVGKRPRF